MQLPQPPSNRTLERNLALLPGPASVGDERCRGADAPVLDTAGRYITAAAGEDADWTASLEVNLTSAFLLSP